MFVRYDVEFDDVAVGRADVRRDRCEGGVVLQGSTQPPAVCMLVVFVMTESQNLQVASLMARKAVRSPVA